ncbi:class I glutamine amidotransferase-like superfamily protein [Actinidia rufa]|uniref:Class I glutamine amidotransferase-like superfamily protein n=1 Tax=Actinidia rufa TaxID=165716 RepID=A0A7J0DDC1_9ERIC|nr:class I glutamine amidotransferase-like superfamily protein [Actinidia rufa]
MGSAKKFSVLHCAEDSDFVKKKYGGYFGVFVGMLAEDGEEWDAYRVAAGEFPDDDAIDGYEGFVITGKLQRRPRQRPLDLQAPQSAQKIGLDEEKSPRYLLRPPGWDIGIRTVHFSPSSKLFASLKMPKMLSVIECHQDEVWELPPKVEVVAWSNKAGIEMFRYGDHIMGIQGHPEYTKDILLHLVDRLLHRDLITEPYADEVFVNLIHTVLAVDTLMQILNKSFNVEDLLHVYTIVRPKKEPSNLFYEGYHYLRLRKPDQPQMRLVTSNPNKDLFLASLSGFRALGNSKLGMTAFGDSREFNDKFKHRSEKCKEAVRAANKQKSRDVDALLLYEPHYRHKIPRRTAEFVRTSIPLQRSSAPRRLQPRKTQSRAQRTPPLSASTRRWGRVVFVVEPEDPALPISISSSDSEHSDDLACARSPSVGEVEDVGPSSVRADIMRFRNLKKKTTLTADPAIMDKRKGTKLSGGMPKSSQRGTRETSSGVDSDLWRPELSACELSRQVMVTNSARDYNTSVALGQAITLPNDVAALSKLTSETMRKGQEEDEQLGVRVEEGKVALADADQLKVDLAYAEAKLGTPTTQSLPKLKTRLLLPRLLLPSFKWWHMAPSMSEFLVGVQVEQGTITTKVAPAPKFPESPPPYSPMILLGFDKEEYMNRPGEDENVPGLILARDIARPTKLPILRRKPGKRLLRYLGRDSSRRLRETIERFILGSPSRGSELAMSSANPFMTFAKNTKENICGTTFACISNDTCSRCMRRHEAKFGARSELG